MINAGMGWDGNGIGVGVYGRRFGAWTISGRINVHIYNDLEEIRFHYFLGRKLVIGTSACRFRHA